MVDSNTAPKKENPPTGSAQTSKGTNKKAGPDTTGQETTHTNKNNNKRKHHLSSSSIIHSSSKIITYSQEKINLLTKSYVLTCLQAGILL
jgi:hypothetical protein